MSLYLAVRNDTCFATCAGLDAALAVGAYLIIFIKSGWGGRASLHLPILLALE